MKRVNRVGFDSFWPLVESRALYGPSEILSYSDVVGFHAYADLRLNLDLAAAEDSKRAMQFIDLLEDYTLIADRCAGLVAARVLEVQGERIHFLVPAAELNEQQLTRLLVFATALTKTIYAELKPKAAEHWQGFSMAADFGPVILVPSSCGGGSVVSLGNAANQPAKQLGRGVTAGHLAIPSTYGTALPGAKRHGTWIEIDVSNPKAATITYFDEVLTGRMRDLARTVLDERGRRATRDFVTALHEGISFSKSPFRTRGMCLRADLDGFTKAVAAASKKGADAVSELVRQFTEIMRYPVEFAQKLDRPVVELPWAGDCCTLLIQPGFHETVEEMRAVLPVEAGRLWHGLAHEDGEGGRWLTALGQARWAIGFACGDRHEGGDGHVIITEFPASGRSFRVIAGWSARRAKDAQEIDGISAEDVVVPRVDHANLEPVFRPLFDLNGSNYRVSNYDRLKNATANAATFLAHSAAKPVAGGVATLPKPRPYWPGC
jgi:hypothetical protein